MNTKTQCAAILRHLQKHGAMTPLEAHVSYGILRLGARVYDLRKAGHRISTKMIPVVTRNGMARVALYKLEK